MTKENLKSIWESTQIIKEKNTFYSFELDKNLATYLIKEKTLTIDLVNISFYSDNDSLDEYIVDLIRNNIIAQALDYENGIEEFHIVFNGKILNKAAI
ncbi:hypothetical protein KO494_09910 [Lacinutrix sp. C3R15]|uniref:hypothetical protein n=1 Tax=Flavobacteriaceae TaxID=49546 RepID=UPI001C0A4485|nr:MULTISPECIES: hypothetical protein [Flavobacteriaceae]MBU2939853.1 hypothetical protein [Lacinutrix sp. C3R15]MDO6623169.1 hypothetical protein [Oceanihabitans sp. 1_MG-2023]